MELRSVLAARAHLGALATLARKERFPLVVLKGGAHAADPGGGHAMLDLDTLVARRHLPKLERGLEGMGMSPLGEESLERGVKRVGPGLLMVEPHTSLDDSLRIPLEVLLERSRPLPGFPPLRRLAPLDHLRHLLVHLLVKHPLRRASLRDLLLVRAALAEVEWEERERLDRWLDEMGLGGHARVLLGEAEAASPGSPDPYRRATALSCYLFLAGPRSWWTRPIPTRIWCEATALGDRDAVAWLLRRIGWESGRESALPGYGRLLDAAPGVARSIRVGARAAAGAVGMVKGGLLAGWITLTGADAPPG